jgi:hypothetical protein
MRLPSLKAIIVIESACAEAATDLAPLMEAQLCYNVRLTIDGNVVE